jgi:C1A family cysteine protease
MENTVNEDAGATLSDGIEILKKFGVCSENIWPYDISKYSQIPPLNCYIEADKHHVIEAVNILNNAFSMKQCLAEGLPFVVGIQIFEAFESAEVAKTGMVPMPNLFTDECLGGHAVLVCGYDENKQVWIVRNSWGTNWGDNGYFYLPYLYLLYPTLCSDLWYISRVQKNVSKYTTNNETSIAFEPTKSELLITDKLQETSITKDIIIEEKTVIQQVPIVQEPPKRSLFDILCSYIPF